MEDKTLTSQRRLHKKQGNSESAAKVYAAERVKNVQQFWANVESATTLGIGQSIIDGTFGEEDQYPVGASKVSSRKELLEEELDEEKMAKKLLSQQIETERIKSKEESVKNDELVSRLKRDKEELENALDRHQIFMDKILKDKKDLSAEVERLQSLLSSAEERHSADLVKLTEKHKKELKNCADAWRQAEKQRKLTWEREQKDSIRIETVQGIEPELMRVIGDSRKDIIRLQEKQSREIEKIKEEYALKESELYAQASDREQRVLSMEQQAIKRERQIKQTLQIEQETWMEQMLKQLSAEKVQIEKTLREQMKIERDEQINRIITKVSEESIEIEEKIKIGTAKKILEAESAIRLAAEKHKQEISAVKQELQDSLEVIEQLRQDNIGLEKQLGLQRDHIKSLTAQCNSLLEELKNAETRVEAEKQLIVQEHAKQHEQLMSELELRIKHIIHNKDTKISELKLQLQASINSNSKRFQQI